MDAWLFYLRPLEEAITAGVRNKGTPRPPSMNYSTRLISLVMIFKDWHTLRRIPKSSPPLAVTFQNHPFIVLYTLRVFS